MLSRVKIPGRHWIPVPQPSPPLPRRRGSLPDMTSRAGGHPCIGHPCMCWMPVVARPGSRRITPRRSGPQSSPGPRGPSPCLWLARLRSCFMPVSVVAFCAPKTRLCQATRAHRNEPVGAHKSGVGDANLNPLCVTRHHSPQAVHAVSTIGAPFRCSRHAPGAGCVMRGERNVLSASAGAGTTRAALPSAPRQAYLPVRG